MSLRGVKPEIELTFISFAHSPLEELFVSSVALMSVSCTTLVSFPTLTFLPSRLLLLLLLS